MKYDKDGESEDDRVSGRVTEEMQLRGSIYMSCWSNSACLSYIVCEAASHHRVLCLEFRDKVKTEVFGERPS